MEARHSAVGSAHRAPLYQAASKAGLKQHVKQQEKQEVEAVCIRVRA